MGGAVILAIQCCSKSLPGSFEKCSFVARSASRSPTFGPKRSAWAYDPPKLTATVLRLPSPFIAYCPAQKLIMILPLYGGCVKSRVDLAGWLRTEIVYNLGESVIECLHDPANVQH